MKCLYCSCKKGIKHNYRGHYLCEPCAQEYAAIFDGWQPKKKAKETRFGDKIEVRTDIDDPLFNAFVRGWKKAEVEGNLIPEGIPNAIKNFYKFLRNETGDDWV